MTGKIKLDVDIVEQSIQTMRNSINKLDTSRPEIVVTNTTLNSTTKLLPYLGELAELTAKIQQKLNIMVDKVEASKTKVVTLDQKLAGK